MPIMARQPNGEYIELCVIPSWINGIRNDISEIKLPTDERIFKSWRTYEGTLPVTLSHTDEGNLMSYKIWGNTDGVGIKKMNLAEGEQLLRNASMGTDGTIVTTSSNFAFRLIPVVEGKEYSIVNIYGAETSISSNFYAFFEELPQIGSVSYNGYRYSFKTPSRTFIAPITGYLATSDYYPMYDEQHLNLIPLEVYEGNASPYYLPMYIHSANLFNINGDTEYQRADTRIENNKIVCDPIAGGNLSRILYSKVYKAGTYTISCDINESTMTHARLLSDVEFTGGTYNSVYSGWFANFKSTVTTTFSEDFKLGFIFVGTAGEIGEYRDVMLVEGSTAPSSYIPYVPPTTVPIYIGREALGKDEYVDSESGKLYRWANITGLSEPLCGIGTYADSLDLSTEMLTRRIKKLVLTGEEQWRVNPTPPDSHNVMNTIVNDALRGISPICTHYIGSADYQWRSIAEGHITTSILSGNYTRLAINVGKESLDDFVSYLATQYAAGTPVMVWYVLAEPETSTISVPSGLTGTIEGYLVQDGTPTPESPIYPTANGVKQTDGAYSIENAYLTPTDPLVPLPQIPTFTKETTYTCPIPQIALEKEVHKDTVNINGIEWDILGYDHDEVYKEDGTLAQHTVTIQTHDCVDTLQFDAREALFALPDGLAAGSYTFTIKAHPGFPSDVDKSITFTLTQAIPSGGQLVVSQSYNASFTTGDIWSYASPFAANPIETAKMTEGDTGVSLGDVTNAIVGNANAIQRAFLGSNRWSASALMQFLNSDKTAGAVWEPRNPFDRPPSWGATTAGFLYGMDTDFISVLGKTKKRTALNTISDGGGYEDSIEKVFLLSRTEVYAGKENNIDEGNPYDYFEFYSDLSAPSAGNDTNRIKYRNGSASYWWLRSPYSSLAHNVELVFPSGALGSYNAVGSNGVAPACCIILDDIDSNPWLRSKFLKYIEAPQPEKVEFTYKLKT